MALMSYYGGALVKTCADEGGSAIHGQPVDTCSCTLSLSVLLLALAMLSCILAYASCLTIADLAQGFLFQSEKQIVQSFAIVRPTPACQ
eukprot:3342464-Pyramimonas_sp.AAC.1